ncbi:ABC transporter ATP-binding protein [Cohnella sp. GCM10027633]|uniref:ABC transporter ATP-binding protein n=1 Tax=unclassified Cohnella TaxID=2636738 RepID=UPI00363415CA
MLSVDRVRKSYREGGWFSSRKRHAVGPISFDLPQGECLGIIGESGSGKSTLGRLVLGIEKPDGGTVRFEGRDMFDRRTRRTNVSAVFQDYASSINPFYRVEQAVMEPLRLRGMSPSERDRAIDESLTEAGLDPSYRRRHAHELSGGEAQRVCIARAVATKPKCLLLDEAISSLDGSIQMQVLETLRSIKERGNSSCLFITHDIQAAAYLCDRIMIIRAGRAEETIEVERLKDARSEYAQRLLRTILA